MSGKRNRSPEREHNASTRAIDSQSEQSAHYNIVTNFAPGIVLSNVCHQQHLNIAVSGNFPIKGRTIRYPGRGAEKFSLQEFFFSWKLSRNFFSIADTVQEFF